MPCMCWYDPPEESKKLIKDLCFRIVSEIRRLEKEGDPIGISIREVKELIDHLADDSLCSEKPSPPNQPERTKREDSPIVGVDVDGLKYDLPHYPTMD